MKAHSHHSTTRTTEKVEVEAKKAHDRIIADIDEREKSAHIRVAKRLEKRKKTALLVGEQHDHL